MSKARRVSGRKIGTELTIMVIFLVLVMITALMVFSISQFSRMNNQQALEMATTGAETLMDKLQDRKSVV